MGRGSSACHSISFGLGSVNDMASNAWIKLFVLILLDHAAADEQKGHHDDPNKAHEIHISSDTAYAVVGVCAAICFVVIIFDIWFVSDSWTRYKRYNTPNKELLQMLEEKDHVFDAKSLQDAVRCVLSMVPRQSVPDAPSIMLDQANIDVFLKGIKESSADVQTEVVIGARDEGQLPIRKDNRVRLNGRPSTSLHISRLSDLFHNPMYLSAAPLPNQFTDHWEAIWQERIGTVVWIGRLYTHENRMDSYIGMTQGEEVTYGHFRIKTVESGEMMFKFALYFVRVFREKEKREIVIIHAYEWLQESVSWAVGRDVELLQTIKNLHCKQMRYSGLRGIMFQCKWGTAGSASLSAVYLGFQFWLHKKQVNLYGILKYIRQMRPMAFEQTGDPGHPFFIQVQVAYAVMYAMAKFCDTSIYSHYDHWIKNLLITARSSE